jgi:RNA polymerase-binding transcription factor DksA
MEAEHIGDRLAAERLRLQELRTEFEAEHLQTETERESLSELTTADQHQAEVATETFDRERDVSILEQVEAELADIEHALVRLSAGTYGTCEACGKPVAEERLEVQPATRFCVDDQAAAEREARPGT